MKGIKIMLLGIAIMLSIVILHLCGEGSKITDIIGFSVAVILIFKGYNTKDGRNTPTE